MDWFLVAGFALACFAICLGGWCIFLGSDGRRGRSSPPPMTNRATVCYAPAEAGISPRARYITADTGLSPPAAIAEVEPAPLNTGLIQPRSGDSSSRPTYGWLEILDGSGRRVEIARDFVRVGRLDDNDIVLKEPTVGRSHATLQATHSGRIVIRDLGSGNGVVVNGTRINRDVALSNGDELQLGSLKFRFLDGSIIRSANTEPVDCSVFAPAIVQMGQTIAIQVSLHSADGFERAEALARIFDPEASVRGSSVLALELDQGAKVDIAIDGDGLEIPQPAATVRWRGDVASCAFRAHVPASTGRTSFVPIVHFFTRGIPIGSVTISIGVGSIMPLIQPGASVIPVRYRRAFVSYSSKDRIEVLKRLQAYEALGFSFFADVFDLQPGDRWETVIKREIETCDLFLLFWSYAARASPWVAREIKHACDVGRRRPSRIPHIAPVMLESAPPPVGLEEIHFNSPIGQIINGARA